MGVADNRMTYRQFANQKALIAYAEQNGLVYLWEGTHTFAKRQRTFSPDQYELVEVRTSRGVMRAAMRFPKAILEAGWAAAAPFSRGDACQA